MSAAKADGVWLADALKDAEEELSKAIALLEDDPRHAQGVLEHEVPALYAKLNFAVNTAYTGPDVIATANHDDLVAWPENLPFERKKHD